MSGAPTTYQDVLYAGRPAVPGRRDCEGRWEIIGPHLPEAGAVLDVGSNLGWFGLKICETRPGAVVASVEADERSAEMQRDVLRSHGHERICLLTCRPAEISRHVPHTCQRPAK